MDKELVNLLRNSISNDYCKIMCLLTINNKDKYMEKYYEKILILYCIIYDFDYFVSKIHKIKNENNNSYDEISFSFLYYMKQKENMDEKLINNLLQKYKNKKKLNKTEQEIQSLNEINFHRKQLQRIHKEYKKDKKRQFYILDIIDKRMDIIALSMKYLILIDELKLNNNPKINRILKWNIKQVKQYDTLEEDILML